MFQTVNEIPDEIKNIVELFYVRDAEIAHSEARRLKESNPELRGIINDVLRLFENAPGSVYLFYDKLTAIYTKSDILDDSFADFSLSDFPKEVDEEVEEPDSGLIDISNMQEPMDPEETMQAKEEAEHARENSSLPPSLSLLGDDDFAPLNNRNNQPDTDAKPAKPDKNTLQLGGDFDLNIELDFDLEGPELDVAGLIDGIDKKNAPSPNEASNDTHEKIKRTLNWGASDFVFNGDDNVSPKKSESVLPQQSSALPPEISSANSEEEFGQPLLSSQQVGAQLAEISTLHQSSSRAIPKPEEASASAHSNHGNVISGIESLDNLQAVPKAEHDINTSDATGMMDKASGNDLLGVEADFFAGTNDVKPARDGGEADFFAGTDDVRPTDDIGEADFFAGTDDVRPADDNGKMDFFADAGDENATSDNDIADAFAKADNYQILDEPESSTNSVDDVVNEIGFPKWDDQLMTDDALSNSRNAFSPETDLFDSERKHASGLGERVGGQDIPQAAAIPALGFRSVPENPSNDNPTPVPGALNRNTAELQFDVDAYSLNGARRSSGNSSLVNSSEEWSNSRKTSPSGPNVQQDRQSFMQVLENEKILSSKVEETEHDTKRKRPNTMWGFQKRNSNALDEKYVSPTALNLTPVAPLEKIQNTQVTSEALTPVPQPITETQKPTNVSLPPIPIEPEPQQYAPEDGMQALQKLKPYSRIPHLTCSMQELLKHSDINSRAGFLLSMIDGCTSISDIFDLSMFPEPETAIELAKLEAEGVIVFD
ncbi:MAG: hypothetical protein J6A01_06045 [Proteobacteria bacterium]|nr:hypothetical protein [Pseudomonadota bacterium]